MGNLRPGAPPSRSWAFYGRFQAAKPLRRYGNRVRFRPSGLLPGSIQHHREIRQPRCACFAPGRVTNPPHPSRSRSAGGAARKKLLGQNAATRQQPGRQAKTAIQLSGNLQWRGGDLNSQPRECESVRNHLSPLLGQREGASPPSPN
jgi:hypothetical protein